MSDAFTITDEQQDYSQYDLNANPFPYSPVPAEDPEIYCGQQHVSDKISSTVSSMLSTGKSKHLVVTGKYGNGKSHTLKYTRSLLRGRDDVVVGYVAQPGEGFLDIYHEFVYDLGFNRLHELAYEFLASVARDVTDTNPIGASGMESLIDEGDVLLSEIVPEAIRRLSDVTKFADFARAIIHMVYEDTNLYAWQWLTAEGIRYEQRKEMEIHSALDDDTMGFSERIGEEVALKPLTSENLYELVRDYLDQERVSSADNEGIEPFSEEALDLILQTSQGNIRQVLSMCSRILDDAAESKENKITAAWVEETV